MGHGLVTVYTKTMSSGGTLTSAYDLGRCFTKIYLEVPTMASGDLFIHGSSDGTTFRRIMREQLNTTTVHSTFSIGSAITQRMVPVPPGFRYYKVENTSGATDVVTVFNLICSDS